MPACGRPVLPDAPIVIVHAAAWFNINLFIILLVQIANKMGSQKEIIFVVVSRRPGVQGIVLTCIIHCLIYQFTRGVYIILG
jgi:hypothetical protein